MPSGARRRPKQVGEQIRQVLADALLREVRDPRLGLMTVTRVEVTPDLGHARISVLVHGSEEERERALEGLNSASGFLRGKVARALATRTTPELEFRLDRGLEHQARIDAILAQLHREEGAS
jgi:ribosome-binding factor A